MLPLFHTLYTKTQTSVKKKNIYIKSFLFRVTICTNQHEFCVNSIKRKICFFNEHSLFEVQKSDMYHLISQQ